MNESLGMVPQLTLAIAVAAPVGGIYDYLAGPAVGAVRGAMSWFRLVGGIYRAA